MVSTIEPAKREFSLPSAPTVIPRAGATHTQPPVGHDSSPVMGNLPGINPADFVGANRIHVKYGSLFVDPYLVIHPRELAETPEAEAALRQKLRLTYSINNPSFFEAPDRSAIALNLGQLIPTSFAAKRSALLEKVREFNHEADTKTDTGLAQQAQDKRHPFAAVVRDAVENPQVDPVGLELLKNGLGVYMLIREKLTQLGFKDSLPNYVVREQTPDQVLADLADKIGVDPRSMREAALKGGLEGVGRALGLDARYVSDVRKLVDYAQSQDFGYNLVEHWHLGRQLLGIDAPLPQKLEVGIDARITAKIDEYRRLKLHDYNVPAPIQAEETRIADALNLVEPVQRALMFRLGYEICYSPEMTADDIAYYKGIYGLHRKAANDLSDVRGTYRIYFSGHGDLKKSYRTLCHEIAHNLWPNQFSKQEADSIDTLLNSDAERFARWQTVMGDPAHFAKFEKFLNAYKAGNDAEKAAVMAETNQWLAHHGVSVDELFPYLTEARDFQFMVKHALNALTVEGDLYNRSGYDSPQERCREIISRFAELKQVEYRGQPQLLHFLAPGLDQIWEAHYIPHLNRVYHAIGPQPAEQVKLTPIDATVPTATAGQPADPLAPLPAPASDAKIDIATVEPAPKVEERPAMPVAAAPKIEERPGTPITAPASTHALSVDGAPQLSIDASTIAMNDRVQAAQHALDAMRRGG